jgi:hypothetical protein
MMCSLCYHRPGTKVAQLSLFERCVLRSCDSSHHELRDFSHRPDGIDISGTRRLRGYQRHHETHDDCDGGMRDGDVELEF